MNEHHGLVQVGDVRDEFLGAIEYYKDMGVNIAEAGKPALKEIGAAVLDLARQKGPRSAVHRGPGNSRRQRWRHPFIHALDTIKVSGVQKSKTTGSPYVVVGPGRGDNSPSFYLKFHEYGTESQPKGHPFLRPARDQVLRSQASTILARHIERYIDRQNGVIPRG